MTWPASGDSSEEKTEKTSKRFYAACQAMQGIIYGWKKPILKKKEHKDIVEKAYKIADEMLKQEEL